MNAVISYKLFYTYFTNYFTRDAKYALDIIKRFTVNTRRMFNELAFF